MTSDKCLQRGKLGDESEGGVFQLHNETLHSNQNKISQFIIVIVIIIIVVVIIGIVIIIIGVIIVIVIVIIGKGIIISVSVSWTA